MPTQTLLFVDQVSSTAQLARLGDTAAAPLRRAFVDQLRTAVTAAGGREMEFGGDGLFAAFGSSLDAVRAAVDIQQSIAAHAAITDPEQHVAVRVGIHTGEPLESDEGGLFGMAVVIAARLCDKATAGEILVSDLTRALTEPRREHRFRGRGPMQLKGVGEPVTVWELLWDPVDPRVAPPAPRPPNPDVSGSGPSSQGGSRTRLTAWLAQRWTDAGGGAAVPSGPVPDRVLDELAALVHTEGGVVIDARGSAAVHALERMELAVDDHLSRLPTITRRLIGLLLGDAATRSLPSLHRSADSGDTCSTAERVAALAAVLDFSRRARPLLVLDGEISADDEGGEALATRVAACFTAPPSPAATAPAETGLLVLQYPQDAPPQLPGIDVFAVSEPLRPVAVPPPTAAVPRIMIDEGRPSAPTPTPAATDDPDALVTTRLDRGPGTVVTLLLPDGTLKVVDQPVTVIGRGSEADITLADSSISRRHAEVRRVDGAVVVRDLGSTNGTTVNGTDPNSQPLVDGDRIEVGRLTLLVRIT